MGRQVSLFGPKIRVVAGDLATVRVGWKMAKTQDLKDGLAGVVAKFCEDVFERTITD